MRIRYFMPSLIAAMALYWAVSLARPALAQTVKVGVINTYSGPLAAAGELAADPGEAGVDDVHGEVDQRVGTHRTTEGPACPTDDLATARVRHCGLRRRDDCLGEHLARIDQVAVPRIAAASVVAVTNLLNVEDRQQVREGGLHQDL